MEKKIRVVRKKIKRKPYIVMYLYMLFVLLSMFVVATYTWFTMSRVPRVTDMNIYITTDSALVLSPDPYRPREDWEMQMNFWDSVDIDESLKPTDVTGHVPLVMQPVTWSEEDQRFWAATYGLDGRLEDYDRWEPLSDSRNANKVHWEDGRYMKATFYARCDMATDVVLAPAMVVDEQGTQGSGTYVIGVPSWDKNKQSHENIGKSAESAIRIGIRSTPMMLTASGQLIQLTERSEMFIYEPNADSHVSAAKGYIPTPSIDGTDTLVDESRLILQDTTTWKDLNVAQIQKVKLTPGQFYADPPVSLFYIRPDEIIKIELYLWIEGQDVDCTNQMNGAQVIANIQFTGETRNQSGLVPIPPEEDEDGDDHDHGNGNGLGHEISNGAGHDKDHTNNGNNSNNGNNGNTGNGHTDH